MHSGGVATGGPSERRHHHPLLPRSYFIVFWQPAMTLHPRPRWGVVLESRQAAHEDRGGPFLHAPSIAKDIKLLQFLRAIRLSNGLSLLYDAHEKLIFTGKSSI
jgi:hypothetical protein